MFYIDKTTLQNLVNCGKSQKEISELFNVSIWIIRRLCRKYKLKSKRVRYKVPLSKVELQKLIDEGYTFKMLATHFKRSPSTVQYWMSYYGLNTICAEKRMSKIIKICIMCGKPLTSKRNAFCSHYCHGEYRYKSYISRWITGQETGLYTCSSVSGIYYPSRYIRRYLIDKNKNTCSICGLNEWMGSPIPLVLDHIDGNSTNCSIHNLRLVCCNCDALLPTYKSKNKGNGRYYRRKRYAENKSF